MEDIFLKVNKVRIEFNTKQQAITHRLEFGGTAVEAVVSSDIGAANDSHFFWYSMPYFNEDVIIDLPDMEVEFLPLTPAEVRS